MSTYTWNVYSNDGTASTISPGNGYTNEIDYAEPVANLPSGTLTWTSSGLSAPGVWQFGVRAQNANGEEQNLDVSVTIAIDENGNDVTNQPRPPVGLRAIPKAGGVIRVEWSVPSNNGSNAPTQYNVYLTPGTTPSYASPSATVAANTIMLGIGTCDLAATGGTQYAVSVRSANASGLDAGAPYVVTTAASTGPGAVLNLSASASV